MNNRVSTQPAKDTFLMSTLLVAGLLMASATPVLGTDARAEAAAQVVLDSARLAAEAASTPTAMRPVIQEPAIIVTAPRIKSAA